MVDPDLPAASYVKMLKDGGQPLYAIADVAHEAGPLSIGDQMALPAVMDDDVDLAIDDIGDVISHFGAPAAEVPEPSHIVEAPHPGGDDSENQGEDDDPSDADDLDENSALSWSSSLQSRSSLSMVARLKA